ncbi:MAG: DUF2125 domain-containing protein [Sulfitobacter sp.]
MTRLVSSTSLTGFGLIFLAQASLADVTPQDVWGDWRDYMNGLGYEITGSEDTSGNTLTVSDVAVDIDLGTDEGTSKMQIGTLRFIDNGDGTVAIELPGSMPIEVTTKPANGKSVNLKLDYTQTGFAMTASGTPTDMIYDYSADTVGVVLNGLTVDGQPMAGDDAQADFTLSNITGRSEMKVASARSYDQSFEAENMTYSLMFKDPKGSGSANFKGAAQGLGFTGQGAIPLQIMQANDVSKMLDAGFSVDGAFTYKGGNSEMAVVGPDGPVSGTTSTTGGMLGVKMSSDGISYDVSQSGLAVNMISAALPLPIDFKVDEAKFNISAPIKKSDESSDFAFGITLGGFTMSDVIWGVFDPQAKLPRDPATIALALSGKMRLLFDFLDPKAAAISGNPNITPAEIDAVNLNNLQVSAVGADLSGTGAFTFDNSAQLNGMPKPTGAVDLKLVGGNGLLDKLVAMGLLPQDQATQARLMMGLLAVAGEGEDTLNSKIEINDQGHILANGQRIQ